MVTHIIKSSQNIEPYNEVKLSKSIIKALTSAHHTKEDAIQITATVIAELQPWFATKSQITSLDIRVRVVSILKKTDQHAALIYKKHKDLW